MGRLYEHKTYILREIFNPLAMEESYEILEGNGTGVLGTANETACLGAKIEKFFLDRALISLRVAAASLDGKEGFELTHSGRSLRYDLTARDKDGKPFARFRQVLCSLFPEFEVFGPGDNRIGRIIGTFNKRHFDFSDESGKVIAVIEHIHGGFLKETFSTADEFKIEITSPEPEKVAPMALAAALSIDLVFHET